MRDKHKLYEKSVQNPDSEISFIRRVYRHLRGQEPRLLREDFCGTAHLACGWVRRVRRGEAVGLDLDAKTLDYARRHNVAALNGLSDRVRLLRQDVLEADRVRGFAPDVVAAFNFSYFVFKDRLVLKRYFERVRQTLASDGVFFLDIYGGPEAQTEQEEQTDHGSFTYVWDQTRYNPVTGEYLCHIHFDFPDGSRMRRAFTYDWRLWTLPEIRDLLEEVGFRQVDVYWEGTDAKTQGGNGVFRKSMKGDDSAAWIAYVVATK